MDYADPTADVTDRRRSGIDEVKVFFGVLAGSSHTLSVVRVTRRRSVAGLLAAEVPSTRTAANPEEDCAFAPYSAVETSLV